MGEVKEGRRPLRLRALLLIACCATCVVGGLVVWVVWAPRAAPPRDDQTRQHAISEVAVVEPTTPVPVESEPTDERESITCFRGNPERNLSGVGAVPRHPKLLWRFETKTKLEGPYEQRGDPSLGPGFPWRGTGWTGQPCIVDGRVYVGSTDSHVYCLDLESGREIWHYGLRHSIKGSISVLDGAIFHGGRDNRVRRYTLGGEMVWETRIGQDTDSNPVIVDGKLFIGGEDNAVYAFDPNDGSVLWRFGPTAGSCESSPCCAEGLIMIGSSGGALYALDADTGERRWEYWTGGDGDPTPVYHEGRVYHAAEMGGSLERGKVHCLTVATGEPLWVRDLPRGVWATVALNPALGCCYVGCNDSVLYCLAMGTGDILWQRRLTGARIWSSPVVADGTILVGVRDGTLWCLDERIGLPLWVFDEGFDIDSTPAVADGRIVIGSQNGWIYCIGEDEERGPLNPHWFRRGPGFDERTDTDPAGVATIRSSAPEPRAHPDTHASTGEGYLQPVYGPGYGHD